MRRRSNWLDNNVFVRLISVMLALALWIGVHSNSAPPAGANLASTTATLRGVPVVVLAPAGMMAVSVRPDRVSVRLTGSVFDVALVQAQSGGLRVVANALHLRAGVHEVVTAVENPPTSAVDYALLPGRAVIDLQRRVTAHFAPQVRIAGAPANGQRVGTPGLSVHRVAVTGPASLVGEVAGVAATVNISGVQGTLIRSVALVPVTRAGLAVSGLRCTPASATVDIPILNQLRRLPLYATTTGAPAPGYVIDSVEVTPAFVVASGPSKQLAGVGGIALPPVHVANWSTAHTITLMIPAPFVGARISQPTAQVTVAIGRGAPVTAGNVPVQITGGRPSLRYTLAGPGVAGMQLIGPPASMSAFQPQDAQAFADVGGIVKPGRYSLPVTVSLPDHVRLVSVAPKVVTVIAQAAPHRGAGG